jgi:hypothetical protein
MREPSSPGLLGVEVFISGSSWCGGLHLWVILALRSLSLGLLGMEVFVSEAFKSSLTSARQKTLRFRVVGPPMHFPISW